MIHSSPGIKKKNRMNDRHMAPDCFCNRLALKGHFLKLFSKSPPVPSLLWNTLDVMLRADTILCNNHANCITSFFVSNLRKHLALFLDDVVWSSLAVVFAVH